MKRKIAALDISAMMWHIIVGYIEGGQLPLSGEESLDVSLLEIYEQQNKLEKDEFLFGRLLGDFRLVARYDSTKFNMDSYPKIWNSLLEYVCDVWRLRGTLVSMKLQNSKKFDALLEVDCLLDSNDVTFIPAGDKSLLEKNPDRTWPLHRIHSWLKTVKSSIEYGKRFAFRNQPRITTFIQKK